MRYSEIEKTHHQTFENIKQLTLYNVEFWFARELIFILNYVSWDKIKRLIRKSIKACNSSGQDQGNHFSQVVKMVGLGSKIKKKIRDFKLFRHACYLIVQNDDLSKPIIVNSQIYFAVKTHCKELADDETFGN